MTSVTDFSIGKNGNKWAVIRDGQPFERQGQYYGYIKTKREAVEMLANLVQRLNYEERILQRAASKPYEWTAEEQKQIAEYAAVLKENKPRLTLNGYRNPVDIAIAEQKSDERCIESWYAWGEPSDHGKVVCVELKLRIAARTEALRIAEVGR